MRRLLALLLVASCHRASPAPTPEHRPAPAPAPPAPHVAPIPPAPPAPPVAAGLRCLAPMTKLPLSGGSIIALAVGDVDRDGAPDVVVVHQPNESDIEGAAAVVLHNDGHGTLAPAAQLELDRSTITAQLADIDGDGALDLVTSATLFDGTGASSLRIHLGKGDGTFTPGATVAIGRDAALSAIGDVTGDGRPEILVGTPHAIDVYRYAHGALARLARIPAGRYPQSAQIVDLDHDGRADVVFVDATSNDLVVAMNRGHGAFTVRPPVPTCTGPLSLAIGDFDGDGKPDALVSCHGLQYVGKPPTAPKVIGLVSNLLAPSPTLAPLVTGVAEQFVLGAPTGDGRTGVLGLAQDMLDTGEMQTRVTLFAADGHGKLAALGDTVLDGQIGLDPAAVDLDRDGRPDVVAPLWTGLAPAYVAIWRGQACAASP